LAKSNKSISGVTVIIALYTQKEGLCETLLSTLMFCIRMFSLLKYFDVAGQL